MGSPLAVFLALRGIRPGNSGSQDHILPREICNRLLNIFHPTDPVVSFTVSFLDPYLFSMSNLVRGRELTGDSFLTPKGCGFITVLVHSEFMK